MEFLHYILIRLQFLTGFFIIFSQNPIHSILFLVLLFFESSVILVLFHVEFVALLFIIIYVGAIAVLFLFVVMMLKLKVRAFSSMLFVQLIVLGIFFLFAFYNLLETSNSLGGANIYSTINLLEPIQYFDSLKDIEVIGQVMYNYYIICFIVAGLILLVALIGAIVLTLNVNKSRQNSVGFKRLARSDNFISFFK